MHVTRSIRRLRICMWEDRDGNCELNVIMATSWRDQTTVYDIG